MAPSPGTDAYVHPDEGRLAAFRRVYDRHLVVEDVDRSIAHRLLGHGVARFAELGGGRGPIARRLASAGVATCVVDLDEQMLSEAHRPAVRGDLRRLPLAAEAFDGIAAVNCLYFLDDPVAGIAEAYRALRPGGTFVASSPSRWNDPELEGVDPSWGTASTFDAEDAAELVGQVFGDVEVETWEVVAYVLPDRPAIADYLHAFNVPRWADAAERLDPPMTITKRGAHLWAVR